MEYLKFILYGIIQGLTEFIPVSSTAHLKIISHIFGIEEPGSSLSAIIQMGSVFAIFWYFKTDLLKLKISNSKRIIESFLFNKLFKSIFVGTIPFVCLGVIIKLFFPYFFETTLRSNISIGIISLLMALYMYVADISKNKFINLSNHNYKNSFLIGLSQALAIVPGVSRSGITISTALFSGWERNDATKYSFLLGIPAISLAAIGEFVSSFGKFSSINILSITVCLLSTFIFSLLAIDFLIKYLSTRGMKLFIYYRLIFGILILLNL